MGLSGKERPTLLHHAFYGSAGLDAVATALVLATSGSSASKAELGLKVSGALAPWTPPLVRGGEEPVRALALTPHGWLLAGGEFRAPDCALHACCASARHLSDLRRQAAAPRDDPVADAQQAGHRRVRGAGRQGRSRHRQRLPKADAIQPPRQEVPQAGVRRRLRAAGTRRVLTPAVHRQARQAPARARRPGPSACRGVLSAEEAAP